MRERESKVDRPGWLQIVIHSHLKKEKKKKTTKTTKTDFREIVQAGATIIYNL